MYRVSCFCFYFVDLASPLTILRFSVLSVAVIKHSDREKLGEDRIYLACTCRSQSIIEGSQGQGYGGKNHGEMLLAGSLSGSQLTRLLPCHSLAYKTLLQ